jgi:transposase
MVDAASGSRGAAGSEQAGACRDEGITYKTLEKVLAHEAPPGYRRSAPYDAPKLGPYVARIEEILVADKAVPRKQRHTAQRIFERLVEEGYKGGYTQVREKVAQLRRTSGEVCSCRFGMTRERRRWTWGRPR